MRCVVAPDDGLRQPDRAHAEVGIGAQVAQLHGLAAGSLTLDELLVRSETHLGTPDEAAA